MKHCRQSPGTRPRSIATTVLCLSLGFITLANVSASAQSLFGNRGPLSSNQGSSTSSALGSGPAANLSGATGNSVLAPSGGFIGRGRPGRRFVGVRQAGEQQGAGERGGEIPTRRAEPGRLGGAETPGPATPARGFGPASRPIVRPRQRIAFSHPVPTPGGMDAAIAAQFEQLAGRYPQFQGVAAEADAGGRVTLRGEVPSEDDRRLVEILVRMQPGVRSVRNDLAIADGSG